MGGRSNQAFTLLELLIVIAIILILIAIALPNFLQAQTRAKVTKAQAEMRTVATALNAYQIDYREYPLTRHDHDQVMHMTGAMRMPFVPYSLTTPVAFIQDVPLDVFKPRVMLDHKHSFIYVNSGNTPDAQIREFKIRVDGYPTTAGSSPQFGLLSAGPDNEYGSMQMLMAEGPPPRYMMMFSDSQSQIQYAPTNGTKSSGDIVQFGP
ncbi:MAG: prepilin-type N-terminal cleavage/methylation domain-containing protein [Candidatus Omnitrophica bacterium]|nr:prepilin-type N-terminal cleavage/methylation domain-containing protein [Candidatus Omnitrophota bacterium]